jgi:hypothetical protein
MNETTTDTTTPPVDDDLRTPSDRIGDLRGIVHEANNDLARALTALVAEEDGYDPDKLVTRALHAVVTIDDELGQLDRLLEERPAPRTSHIDWPLQVGSWAHLLAEDIGEMENAVMNLASFAGPDPQERRFWAEADRLVISLRRTMTEMRSSSRDAKRESSAAKIAAQ